MQRGMETRTETRYPERYRRSLFRETATDRALKQKVWDELKNCQTCDSHRQIVYHHHKKVRQKVPTPSSCTSFCKRRLFLFS